MKRTVWNILELIQDHLCSPITNQDHIRIIEFLEWNQHVNMTKTFYEKTEINTNDIQLLSSHGITQILLKNKNIKPLPNVEKVYKDDDCLFF